MCTGDIGDRRAGIEAAVTLLFGSQFDGLTSGRQIVAGVAGPLGSFLHISTWERYSIAVRGFRLSRRLLGRGSHCGQLQTTQRSAGAGCILRIGGCICSPFIR